MVSFGFYLGIFQFKSNFHPELICTLDQSFSMRKLVLFIYCLWDNKKTTSQLVGKLSDYLDLGSIELAESVTALNEVVITGRQDTVAETLDKKTFTVSDNVAQSGGSLFQVMQNLFCCGYLLTTLVDGKLVLKESTTACGIVVPSSTEQMFSISTKAKSRSIHT